MFIYIILLSTLLHFSTILIQINVFQIADKLIKGKLSVAAIGNLKTVPYIDELK